MSQLQNARMCLLIQYAYKLGGNTRDIARLTGIEHDNVVDMLLWDSSAHEPIQDNPRTT